MPPRPATWLVDLFAPPSRADAILGDLLEEFTSIAAASGQRAARRRYWRQAIKTQATCCSSRRGRRPGCLLPSPWSGPTFRGYPVMGSKTSSVRCTRIGRCTQTSMPIRSG